MNISLRDTPNIMIRRISSLKKKEIKIFSLSREIKGKRTHLFHEQKRYPLEHLVSIERRHRHVQKQAIQDRCGNIRQRVGKQKDRESDQDVGE